MAPLFDDRAAGAFDLEPLTVEEIDESRRRMLHAGPLETNGTLQGELSGIRLIGRTVGLHRRVEMGDADVTGSVKDRAFGLDSVTPDVDGGLIRGKERRRGERKEDGEGWEGDAR